MTLADLSILIDEYLLTLDDKQAIEWYDTNRSIATAYLRNEFLKWLKLRRTNDNGSQS